MLWRSEFVSVLLMKNSRYHPTRDARRQRLFRRIGLVWRIGLVVVVNFSAWIVAEDSAPNTEDIAVTFSPFPADVESVPVEGRPDSDASDVESENVQTSNAELRLNEEGTDLESDRLPEGNDPTENVAVTAPELPAMSFLRPEWTAATDRYRPSRESEKHSRKGLQLHLDTGYGYDSTSRQQGAGQKRVETEGGVSWLEVGGSYDGDLGLDDGALLFYGSNFGAGLYTIEQDEFVEASETVDFYLNPYIGLQGQKTLLQLDGFYDQFEGNDTSYKNSGRESLGAEGERTGARVFGVRLFDHSTLTTGFDYSFEDFSNDEAFNDRRSWVGDLTWLYKPGRLPKIEAGTGVSFGEFETGESPDMRFAAPMLQTRYQFSPKTVLDCRAGYTFREFSGEDGASSDGDTVFSMTADWQASERWNLHMKGFRDSSPSLQNDDEYYTSTGVRVDLGYRMLPLRLHLTLAAAYERAEYDSATTAGEADRSDDYFWFNTAVSRRLDVDWLANPTVSLFYNRREIASNRPDRDFRQDFGGVKMGFTF